MNFSIFSLWRPNAPSQREGRLLPQRIIVHQGQGVFGGVPLDYLRFTVPLGTTLRIRQRNFKG